MRIAKEELMILRLKDEVPAGPRLNWLREMTKGECLDRLRELSGADFGDDVEHWEAWWRDQKALLGLD